MSANDWMEIKNQKNEDQVRASLTEWCEEHGATVYWGEQVEGFDQPSFKVQPRGINSWNDEPYRPDMLVVGDEKVIVVEVKIGDQYGVIADGVFETFDYWCKHHEKRPVYRTDDGLYEPDSFTYGTRYAPYGHLYPDDHEFYYSNGSMYGTNERVPQYEANMASVTVRALWRFAQNQDYDISTGVGLLVSDILEDLPRFSEQEDSYGMVRASDIDEVGQPAVFHWNGDQDWISPV